MEIKKPKKKPVFRQNSRHFVIIHSQGKDEISANSKASAIVQVKEIFKKKGMKYPQDRKDFYEVIT